MYKGIRFPLVVCGSQRECVLENPWRVSVVLHSTGIMAVGPRSRSAFSLRKTGCNFYSGMKYPTVQNRLGTRIFYVFF